MYRTLYYFWHIIIKTLYILFVAITMMHEANWGFTGENIFITKLIYSLLNQYINSILYWTNNDWSQGNVDASILNDPRSIIPNKVSINWSKSQG